MGITRDEQVIAPLRDERTQKAPLGRVEVLRLVHDHVTEAPIGLLGQAARGFRADLQEGPLAQLAQLLLERFGGAPRLQPLDGRQGRAASVAGALR